MRKCQKNPRTLSISTCNSNTFFLWEIKRLSEKTTKQYYYLPQRNLLSRFTLEEKRNVFTLCDFLTFFPPRMAAGPFAM